MSIEKGGAVQFLFLAHNVGACFGPAQCDSEAGFLAVKPQPIPVSKMVASKLGDPSAVRISKRPLGIFTTYT